LAGFYVEVASHLSTRYNQLDSLRSDLKQPKMTPPEQILFKSLIDIKEGILVDCSHIIHAIRPHVMEKKDLISVPAVKERVEEVGKKLKEIALEENAYQWGEISPKFQEIWKQFNEEKKQVNFKWPNK